MFDMLSMETELFQLRAIKIHYGRAGLSVITGKTNHDSHFISDYQFNNLLDRGMTSVSDCFASSERSAA